MKSLILSILVAGSLSTAQGSSFLKSKLLNHEKSVDVALKDTGESSYTVKEGDTVASIASDHHITIRKLIKTNALPKNRSLEIGSKLLIPDQTIKLSEVLATIKNAGPILEEAKKHLGKTYIWGANGPKTFDCSGFTCYVTLKNGIRLPRTSIEQGEVGTRVARYELKQGDLVFFDTSKERKGFINHVGIYIGNGKFIHASSGAKKVVISSLNQSFYKERFLWGQRINRE